MAENKKSIEMQERLLCVMVTMAGQDITAPDQVFEEEVQSFKIVKDCTENDNAIDALVALNNCASDQEKLEVIKILCIKMLPLTKTFKLMSFLRDYGAHMLDFFKEHPEVRKEDSFDASIEALFDDD